MNLKWIGRAALGLALTLAATSAKAGIINVDIYAGFTDVGGGAPYTDLVGSFTDDDILFATETGYDWHPFGLGSFGADITGCLLVAADGEYSFTLNSDDGSLLFIDGGLVVDNGGPHGPAVAMGSVVLSAGMHAFEVQFFEDFGGPSGVDLYLPEGVSYAACVPEPSSLALAGLAGLAGLAAIRRRRLRLA